MGLLIILSMLKKNMEFRITLNKDQIEFLSKLPEQGLGYQLVDLTLKNGRVLRGIIVLNSTYLKLNEAELIKADDIDKIELHQK
jgi:hypothetical protein